MLNNLPSRRAMRYMEYAESQLYKSNVCFESVYGKYWICQGSLGINVGNFFTVMYI